MKRILGMIFLCVFLVACTSKATHSNFDKIKDDMTKDQVVSILGRPSEEKNQQIGALSATTAMWKGNKTVFTIQFLDNRVASKQRSNNNKTRN